MSDARLHRAVRLVLLGGLAAIPAAHANAVAAPEAAPDSAPLTGSRLTGAAAALPVTVITREEIDASGRASLADLLRDIAGNSFGSFRPQSGSSAQALAALDLRGLGTQRTLILVDGRRAPQAPYAPNSQDLNAIPLGAVERIEILHDGASAIYGSGAIGGVVNVVLRERFSGTQFMAGRGYTDLGGGDTSQAAFVMGLPTGSGDVVVGASYNTRDVVFSRELVAAGLQRPGASFFANNYVSPADGFATVNIVPGGCAASEAFVVVEDACDIGSCIPEIEPMPICVYDFNRVAANDASLENMALYAKGRFAIGEDWAVRASSSISRVSSFGRYAPAPALLFVPGAASGIDHDGDGTDDTVYVYHRYDALGPRDDVVDSQVYDLLAGFEGKIGGLDADFGGRFNEYKAFVLGRNYVVDPIAAQLATDGTYNFRDPLANPESVLDQMRATISRGASWSAQEWWASIGGAMLSLPGGAVSFRLGAESYTVDFDDRYDSLQEGGAIGGAAGNSSGIGQDTQSWFAELGVPLTQRLHAGFAARYEERSGLGSHLAPRVNLAFAASDDLTVRAAYGESFGAPPLDVISMLPASSTESIDTDQATCLWFGGVWSPNARRCSISTPVPVTTIANPQLAREEARHYTAGFAYEPSDMMKVALDYYRYALDDAISLITPTGLLDIANSGGPLPPGLSLTRNPAQGNRLVSIIAGYANRGTLESTGLNLDASTRWSLGAAGVLGSRLQAGYVMSYRFCDGCDDTVGGIGTPEWRASWDNTWRSGRYALTWNQVAIADHAEARAWWTHDVQFGYDLPFNAGALAVGALNVTNEMPAAEEYDGRPFNMYLYNAYGRTPYARYTLTFR